MRFTELTDLFIQSRISEGYRPNTLLNYRRAFKTVGRVLGDVPEIKGTWRNGSTQGGITAQHMDTLFAALMEEGRLAHGSINNVQYALQSLFKWARARGYIYPDQDPMAGRKALKYPPADRARLSLGQFQQLLELDIHPRDKMLLSLGMFLLLRQSEARSLIMSDIDLDANTIRVTVHKSKIVDVMRVPLEMRPILREYLTYYAEEQGPLQGHWFLVPAKDSQIAQYRAGSHDWQQLRPTSPINRVADHVNRALDMINFPTRDAFGKSLREGMHTLRRSAALNIYTELCAKGTVDESMRFVQNMLHHKSIQTTERYLGLQSVTEARNKLLDGELLYPSLAGANVVPIGRSAHATGM